jgi:hypothetical protein
MDAMAFTAPVIPTLPMTLAELKLEIVEAFPELSSEEGLTQKYFETRFQVLWIQLCFLSAVAPLACFFLILGE